MELVSKFSGDVTATSFGILSEDIENIEREYGDLGIAGFDDRAGLLAVTEARKHVKRVRVAVENARKRLKQESLEYGRKVDAAAKLIVERLSPVENRLIAIEESVEAEKRRIAEEAERKRREFIKARVDAITATGATCDPIAIADMPQGEFDELLANAKEAKRLADDKAAKAEAERLAKEAEERQRMERERLALEAERKRLEAIQAELDAKRREQEAAEQKIRDEAARIEREKAEEDRRKQAEIDRQENERRLAEERTRAAEKAAADERERIERERIEAEAKEERRKKMLPNAARVREIAQAVNAIEVSLTPEARAYSVRVLAILETAANDIAAIADEMEG